MIARLALLFAVVSLVACGPNARGASPTPTATARTASGAPSASPSPVPAEYASIYRSIQGQLDLWDRSLPPERATRVPVFGGHVLASNGNRGADLLASETMPTVDLSLDAMKRLGAKGVSVTISFPLFNASWPRANDYIAFYETVAKHVRDRGLVLSVEQHVAFVGTSFSSVQFDFRSTTFDEFVALERAMTRTIVERIQPDYLTLLSEPDTFAKITGYREASTPQGAAAMVQRIVARLDRGRTRIGAGAGSWLPDAPQYDLAFARAGLDYIDLHIYPLTAATLNTTQEILDVARLTGKPIVLDEAWLYKIGSSETVAPSLEQQTDYFRRDAFSFWEPLDARFLTLLARWARSNDVAYVAPFWTTYFFGDVAYDAKTKDLPYPQLAQQVNQSASRAMRQGNVTPTGIAYAQAIVATR